MKNIIAVIVMFAAAFVVFAVADFSKSEGRVYDCGMAEWHPDIPNAVKEECRRIRYEEWKRQQENKNKGKGITT